VRAYEIDPWGHVNQAVYLQYAEHARFECLQAAGVSHERLVEAGIGPVALENTIRYLAELRAGDEIDLTVEFEWGAGKTFRIKQDYLRADGTMAATLTSVVGVLDLAERRLVDDAAVRLRALATTPEALGV
jgi:acyl-CoA thioester hydrolase